MALISHILGNPADPRMDDHGVLLLHEAWKGYWWIGQLFERVLTEWHASV